MRSIGLDVGKHAEVAIREPGRPTRSGGRISASSESRSRPAYTGHISHAGQGHVRGLLVEAALGAVKVPGPLHAFYARLADRRGPGSRSSPSPASSPSSPGTSCPTTSITAGRRPA